MRVGTDAHPILGGLMAKLIAGVKLMVQLVAGLVALMQGLKEAAAILNQARREGYEQEIRDAFKILKETGDTRPLEKAIGSHNSGKPTTNPHDDIQERPGRDRSQQP
jgi:hypothetical protein